MALLYTDAEEAERTREMSKPIPNLGNPKNTIEI